MSLFKYDRDKGKVVEITASGYSLVNEPAPMDMWRNWVSNFSNLVWSTRHFTIEAVQTPAVRVPRSTRKKEIMGWRLWNIEGTMLESLFHAWYLWNGPTLRSSKRPTATNTSGFYAFRRKSQALLYEEDSDAYGQVAMSGQVVVCENGFRAERDGAENLYSSDGQQGDERSGDYPCVRTAVSVSCQIGERLMEIGPVKRIVKVEPAPFPMGKPVPERVPEQVPAGTP